MYIATWYISLNPGVYSMCECISYCVVRWLGLSLMLTNGHIRDDMAVRRRRKLCRGHSSPGRLTRLSSCRAGRWGAGRPAALEPLLLHEIPFTPSSRKSLEVLLWWGVSQWSTWTFYWFPYKITCPDTMFFPQCCKAEEKKRRRGAVGGKGKFSLAAGEERHIPAVSWQTKNNVF